LEVFDAGRAAEEWWFEEGQGRGSEGRQAELELAVTSRIVIRGHVDALDEIVIEVKSQTDKEWDAWTPAWFDTDPMWMKYRWQMSVYMLATGKELMVVRLRGRPEPDGSWEVRNWAFHQLEKPFFDLDEVRARVFEAERIAGENELKCKATEFFCPYPYLHERADTEEVDDPELEEMVRSYRETRGSADEMGKIANGLKSRILERLKGRGKVRLVGSGRQVSVAEVEVKEHVVKASTQTRLTVREPK